MLFLKRLFAQYAFTIVPVILAVTHVTGWVRLSPLEWVDRLVHDARARAIRPGTQDERIVIIDIDESSLAAEGRWPWPREKLAKLVNQLFEDQKVAVVGFDMVFAEPENLGLANWLNQLATAELMEWPDAQQKIRALAHRQDGDAMLAAAFSGRPVILGHYFSSDRGAHRTGQLPVPVWNASHVDAARVPFIRWTGYGANLPDLIGQAKDGGFFNAVADDDGVIRSVPLLSMLDGRVYQSFALAMLRAQLGVSTVEPVLASMPDGFQGPSVVEAVRIRQREREWWIPVDHRISTLVPYRGEGGPDGGAFRYVRAADVLAGRLEPEELKNKMVLIGTTAPGLWDVRVTPVSPTFPGVEVHANLLAGFMDGGVPIQPDYASGYELALVCICGMLLALMLPRLSAIPAVLCMCMLLVAVVGLNQWLYVSHHLILPLASSIFLVVSAFVFNTAYGYVAESRSKRHLAELFGTYVPPELVDEMVKSPQSYSMAAESRVMTVLFCDMKGFTKLSEELAPEQLQHLLNRVFNQLTEVIVSHKGTVDKYMGDCVMAFWGAPVRNGDHAVHAVDAAQSMTKILRRINTENEQQGLPVIGIGIGINTGQMLVGDMGSNLRRSYTVIGDAVNLASRIESLSRVYGVDVVVGEATRNAVSGVQWRLLDKVVVKGKRAAVNVYTTVNG